MFCYCGSCKPNERGNEEPVCNIVINIPVTYGAATTTHAIRRDCLFSQEPGNIPLSTGCLKKLCVFDPNEIVCNLQEDKPRTSCKTFIPRCTTELNEDIQRCSSCPARRTAQTYFKTIPIDLRSAANPLEGCENYGIPALVNDIQRCSNCPVRRTPQTYVKNIPIDLRSAAKSLEKCKNYGIPALINEDIQRCSNCSVRKIAQTSFTNIPIDLGSAANPLERYQNFSTPVLKEETWYRQNMKCPKQPQTVYYYEDCNKGYAGSTPFSINSEINYQGNNRNMERHNNIMQNEDVDKNHNYYKYCYNFLCEKDKMKTDDDDEEILPKYVDQSSEIGYIEGRKEPREQYKLDNEIKMDDDSRYVIEFRKPNISPNSPFPMILTFGGLTSEPPSNFALANGATIYKFYPLLNEWTFAGLMPVLRSYHTAVLVDNEIFIIGGFDHDITKRDTNVVTNEVISYKINKCTWHQRANLLCPRSRHNSVVYNGIIYTLGGVDDEGRILQSVEKYDPRYKKWIKVQEMPYPVTGAACCVFHEHIFVIGGISMGLKTQEIISEVICYNPKDDKWIYIGLLPYPIAYSSCARIDSDIWLIGGIRCTEKLEIFDEVLVFDGQTLRWFENFQLLEPRHSATCVSFGSCAFIIGGSSKDIEDSVNTVEGIQGINIPAVKLESLPNDLRGTASVALIPTNPQFQTETMIKNALSEQFMKQYSKHFSDPSKLSEQFR